MNKTKKDGYKQRRRIDCVYDADGSLLGELIIYGKRHFKTSHALCVISPIIL